MGLSDLAEEPSSSSSSSKTSAIALLLPYLLRPNPRRIGGAISGALSARRWVYPGPITVRIFMLLCMRFFCDVDCAWDPEPVRRASRSRISAGSSEHARGEGVGDLREDGSWVLDTAVRGNASFGMQTESSMSSVWS